LELQEPILTEASRRANFSNELGVDGTVRFLRNTMGLWLLQESLRSWQADGLTLELSDLVVQARGEPELRSVVDPNNPEFMTPGNMPSRIRRACMERGEQVPESPAQVVRCIMDSLALAHRRAVLAAQRLSGQAVEAVHIVGGGARNSLLCQLTADACGVPVVAGPIEASAIGNALVQARAMGALAGGLAELRTLVQATLQTRKYTPADRGQVWLHAETRVYGR